MFILIDNLAKIIYLSWKDGKWETGRIKDIFAKIKLNLCRLTTWQIKTYDPIKKRR
jgi:hypothetical protein